MLFDIIGCVSYSYHGYQVLCKCYRLHAITNVMMCYLLFGNSLQVQTEYCLEDMLVNTGVMKSRTTFDRMWTNTVCRVFSNPFLGFPSDRLELTSKVAEQQTGLH